MERRLSNLVVGCLAALATMLLVLGLSSSGARPGTELPGRATYLANGETGPYDPQPDHIWNRLHRHFFGRVSSDGRQFGVDELDPLLWYETKYLVSGPSHKQALKLLDEFLAKRAENLITDPLKHAVLQRDLWAIFDWLSLKEDHRPERQALQVKLARVIQSLALTADQIQLLPDNYAAAAGSESFPKQYQPERHEAAFLPPDLFQPKGPWIVIGDMRGRLPAPVHTASSPFNGRSTFLVLIRLPAGREATASYLKKLREFSRPWIVNPDKSVSSERLIPNPQLPQFPEGTQTALVRRMILIDREGNLRPTSLTESVQIRVYRSIPAGVEIEADVARRTQDVFEFTLNRRKLFDGVAGSLREILRDEKNFMLFRAHGIDWLEQPGDPERSRGVLLSQCADCHASPGIHSVLSYSERRFLSATTTPAAFAETTIADQEQLALSWKRRQFESGLLRGLWQTARP
jgi:hypothetical protein